MRLGGQAVSRTGRLRRNLILRMAWPRPLAGVCRLDHSWRPKGLWLWAGHWLLADAVCPRRRLSLAGTSPGGSGGRIVYFLMTSFEGVGMGAGASLSVTSTSLLAGAQVLEANLPPPKLTGSGSKTCASITSSQERFILPICTACDALAFRRELRLASPARREQGCSPYRKTKILVRHGNGPWVCRPQLAGTVPAYAPKSLFRGLRPACSEPAIWKVAPATNSGGLPGPCACCGAGAAAPCAAGRDHAEAPRSLLLEDLDETGGLSGRASPAKLASAGHTVQRLGAPGVIPASQFLGKTNSSVRSNTSSAERPLRARPRGYPHRLYDWIPLPGPLCFCVGNDKPDRREELLNGWLGSLICAVHSISPRHAGRRVP